MTAPRAVLIGTMGAGKSTVGQLVADALGVGFADTDAVIEERAGKTVQEMFVDDGEQAFRALERSVVAELLAGHDGVLSLGGGAILDPATQALLTPHRVVFLRVGLAEAVKRVGLGVGRPLLLGNVRSRVKLLLDERTPIYEGLARIVVDTDERDAHDVADRVVTALAALEDHS